MGGRRNSRFSCFMSFEYSFPFFLAARCVRKSNPVAVSRRVWGISYGCRSVRASGGGMGSIHRSLVMDAHCGGGGKKGRGEGSGAKKMEGERKKLVGEQVEWGKGQSRDPRSTCAAGLLTSHDKFRIRGRLRDALANPGTRQEARWRRREEDSAV